MYAAKYIFSKRFFQAWLVVAIIWIRCTLLIAGLFPLIGEERQFVAVYRALRYGMEGSGSWESMTPVENVNMEKVEGKQ